MSAASKFKLKIKKNKSKTSVPHLYHKFILSDKKYLDRISIDDNLEKLTNIQKKHYKKIKKSDDPFKCDLSHSAGYDSMVTAAIFFFMNEFICIKLKDQFYEIKKEMVLKENKMISISIEEWVKEILRINMKNRMFSPRAGGFNFNDPKTEAERFNLMHNYRFEGNSFLVKLNELDDINKLVFFFKCFEEISMNNFSENLMFFSVGSSISNEKFKELNHSLKEFGLKAVRYVDRNEVWKH
jgi:hypothetical protein